MADYNVNMKQWNGSSFDNVLPLAYDSNKIDGKTWTQVTQLLLEKSGGTMTGDLILNGDPKLKLQASTKQYVDEKISYFGQTRVGYGGKTCRVEYGSYIGDGTKGKSLSTALYPVAIFTLEFKGEYVVEMVRTLDTTTGLKDFNKGITLAVSWEDKAIHWTTIPNAPSSTQAKRAGNSSGVKYYYVVIGYDKKTT